MNFLSSKLAFRLQREIDEANRREDKKDADEKFFKNYNVQFWSLIIAAVGLAVTIAGLAFLIFLGVSELRNVRLQQSAQFMLDLEENLSSETNLKIMQAIENSQPILKQNGGRFFDWQLDNYLGKYELLYNLEQNGLLADDMIYSAFSYNLVHASENHEILSYIQKFQEHDPDVFAGFEELAKEYK